MHLFITFIFISPGYYSRPNASAKFWGANKVHCGRCASGILSSIWAWNEKQMKKNVITVIRCRLSKGLTSFSSLLFFPSHGARETLETRRFMIIPKQVYDVKLDDNDVDRCAFVKLNWVVYITNINKRLVIRQPSHGAKEWERTLGTRSSHTLFVMFYMEWFKLCFLSGENRICTMSMSAFEV